MNALNTVWDLMLVKPYRDGGPALERLGHRADSRAPSTCAAREPSWRQRCRLVDRDRDALEDPQRGGPGQRPPKAGEQWRVNFSRVQWSLDVKDGKYMKRTDAKGELLPENNWVWSPQGAVNMHMPERWGHVQFSSRRPATGADTFTDPPDEAVAWNLRRIYYRQADFHKANGRYARTLRELGSRCLRRRLPIARDRSLYVMTAPGTGGVVHLRQDGRLWTGGVKGER